MKIVIDIPEEDYLNLIKTDENGEKEIPLGLLMSLWDNVKYNCAPLPKGRGDLIDRTEVIKNLFDYYNGKKTIGQCIDNVPTIIEAESEDKE